MWASILAFLTTNAMKVGAITLAGLSVGAVLLGARREGQNAERAEELQRQLNLIGKAREIEKSVNNMPDGAALAELRQQWARKSAK